MEMFSARPSIPYLNSLSCVRWVHQNLMPWLLPAGLVIHLPFSLKLAWGLGEPLGRRRCQLCENKYAACEQLVWQPGICSSHDLTTSHDLTMVQNIAI